MIATWLKSCLAGIAVLGGLSTAQSQLSLVWTRFYANQTWFDKVVVDVNNNVYCLGRQYAPSDTILVKYNSSGTYQWIYRIMPGAPIADVVPVGHVVDSAGYTYIFYRTGTSGALRARLDKVSPTGTLVWTRNMEDAAGSWVNYIPYSIALDNLERVCVVYTRGTSLALNQWRFRRYNAAGTIEG